MSDIKNLHCVDIPSMASRAKAYYALPLLIFHLCHVGEESEKEATCIWLQCYDNHSVEISFHRIVTRQICYWVKGHSNWGTYMYGIGIFTELVVHVSYTCRCISTNKLISGNRGDSEFSPGLFTAFAGFLCKEC